METHNVLSPPNRAIYGFTSLWVEGHALVAGFGRFWKFQHRNSAMNLPLLAAGGGHTNAAGSEGPLAINIPVFHLCSISALDMLHLGSIRVPFTCRYSRIASYEMEQNGTKRNTEIDR